MSGASGIRGAGRIKGTAGTGEVRVNTVDDKSTVTELGPINIEGRMYKPSVFYVLGRGNISYQGIQLHQDFTDKILKGALTRPF